MDGASLTRLEYIVNSLRAGRAPDGAESGRMEPARTALSGALDLIRQKRTKTRLISVKRRSREKNDDDLL